MAEKHPPGSQDPADRFGALRRSIRGTVRRNTVQFSSSLTYASIHNEGGTLTVTTRMKKYFWAKYRQATGSLSTTKTGKVSRSKRNLRLSAMAQFYKAMALAMDYFQTI